MKDEIEEAKKALCMHDTRNPDGCSCEECEAGSCPGQVSGCGCDNCFYGRHALAETAISALELAHHCGTRFYLALSGITGAEKHLRPAWERIDKATSNGGAFPKKVVRAAISKALQAINDAHSAIGPTA